MLLLGFLFWGNGSSSNSIGRFSSPSTSSPSLTVPDDDSNDQPFVLLGVGLPYTGSLNLHRFWQCHNTFDDSNEQVLIDSYHYCCGNHTQNQVGKHTHFPCPQKTCGQCIHQNMLQRQHEPWRDCGVDRTKNGSPQNPTSKKPSIQAFNTLDVETDEAYSWFLPQHFALPLLLPSYKSQSPKPIWILTQRVSATVWAQSIMHWYSRTRRLFRAFNLPYHHPHLNDEQAEQHSSHRDESLLTVGLSHSTNQHELYKELDIGIARAQNHTLYHERQRLLENVYHEHLQRVSDFCKFHQIPLISLVVDDPRAGEHLSNELRRLIGGNNPLAPDTENAWSFQEACWTFDADELDEDWKNFTLPF